MQNEVIVISEEPKEVVETQVPAIRRQAQELVVQNPSDRGIAEGFVKRLREMKVTIEDRFKPTKNKQDARKIWDQLVETEKAFYVPIEEAIDIVRGTVKEYDRKAAIAAREAQEKADRDQRDAEEKEVQRILQESMRLKREGQSASEGLESAKERLEKVKNELADARDRLASAEAGGNKSAAQIARIEISAKEREMKVEEKTIADLQRDTAVVLNQAEVLQEQSESVVVEPKPAPVPQTGTIKKLSWRCRVVSPKVACKSIADGLAPFTSVEFRQAELNKMAKDYDGQTRIPGFEFYEDVSGRI